jgi:hypothetical protein
MGSWHVCTVVVGTAQHAIHALKTVGFVAQTVAVEALKKDALMTGANTNIEIKMKIEIEIEIIFLIF